MSRKHMHQRRYDDTWSVKGVLITHPKRPTLTKREAIGEGVLDWQDIAEQANCLSDGLVIDCEAVSDWGRSYYGSNPRAPFRTESDGYDVRTRQQRIMARIEADDRAKRERTATRRDYVPTPQRAAYGSLIQRRTRR